MSEGEDNKSGFKVNDRRRFDAQGNARDVEDEPRAPLTAPPPAVTKIPAAEHGPRTSPPNTPSGQYRAAHEGGIGFAEFILSLGTNAAVLLGGEDAERVANRVDLGAAAQYIDILHLLKAKTAGNLEPDETRLMDTLLYDLQMRFLEVQKSLGAR